MKYFPLILTLLFLFPALNSIGQVHEDKNWCQLNCNPSIIKENAQVITEIMRDDSLRQLLDSRIETKVFPIRFVLVKEQSFNLTDSVRHELDTVLSQLNEAFKGVGFVFERTRTEVLESAIKLEELSQNRFELYDKFSAAHDQDDILTVFILDHKNDFCTVTDNSISCSRIGGFSYVLSSLNNNIVMSEFDIKDPKIVAHEFGHFFGLYHTFEERLFGKDNFNESDCLTTGDRICDTSPDPGTAFELYINYATCEMIGFKDENGNEYKPILENYMSYYKPCYLKKYSFTKDQEMVMKLAGELPIRKRLSK